MKNIMDIYFDYLKKYCYKFYDVNISVFRNKLNQIDIEPYITKFDHVTTTTGIFSYEYDVIGNISLDLSFNDDIDKDKFIKSEIVITIGGTIIYNVHISDILMMTMLNTNVPIYSYCINDHIKKHNIHLDIQLPEKYLYSFMISRYHDIRISVDTQINYVDKIINYTGYVLNKSYIKNILQPCPKRQREYDGDNN